jgi:hypothetical protein
MRFTDEMAWTAFDFAFVGALLLGMGLVMELTLWKASSWAYRFGIGIAAAAAVFLIVATGAVGVIGSEDDPANLAYAGVLLVAVGGALVSMLRAKGMAVSMAAAALVQAGIGAWALATGQGQDTHIWPMDVIGATGVFCALWLASAWLFLQASRGRSVAA